MPPHGELTAPAPHDGEIDREHEKPKRDHPKAEHGEEADETANHEQNAEPDADRLRLRQVPVALKMRTLGAIGCLALVAGQAGHKGYAEAPQPAPSSRQAPRPRDRRKALERPLAFCYLPGRSAA